MNENIVAQSMGKDIREDRAPAHQEDNQAQGYVRPDRGTIERLIAGPYQGKIEKKYQHKPYGWILHKDGLIESTGL